MAKARKIIHVDMDAFFAQVEQRDNPAYKNKPLIVGGPLNRGVISSASYEARKYGLHAGMPLARAKRLCPDGIFVAVDMEKYLKESVKIREVFFQYTPLVEIVSCDEGFLDVTGCEKLFGSALEIAKKIKSKIYEKTNLTSSAGIGPNKFLAKLASNMGKPNGLTVLEDKKSVIEKIKLLPVSCLWGVGRVTCKDLEAMGAETIGDVANMPVRVLRAKFGEIGETMHSMANGIDNREVIPYSEPKSIGREITYRKDITDFEILKSTLLFLSQKISRNLYSKKYKGKTLTLKVRFSDFKTITKRITLSRYTFSISGIFKPSVLLLERLDLTRKKVRLVGISVSSLKPVFVLDNQLFYDECREEKLTDAIGEVSEKFGEDKLVIARLVEKDKTVE